MVATDPNPGFRAEISEQKLAQHMERMAQEGAANMKAAGTAVLVLIVLAVLVAAWVYRRRQAIAKRLDTAAVDGAAIALRTSRVAREKLGSFAARVRERAADRPRS